MDHKTFEFKVTSFDAPGRTVEGYANVFGNKDLTGDIVHPGAFAKTLVERGGKIRFLWQHDTSEPLGKIVEMQEDNHGLFMKAVVSDTARGRDALALLNDGAINSFSIGYDAVKGGTDYTKDPLSGDVIRNLREIKLWEVSLVTIPANEQATVTALKEQKPYNVFHDGEQYCVYKVDPDGNRTGDPLGCHGTEDEARAQVEVLYANENPKDVEPQLETKAGRVLARRNAERLAQIRKLLEELEKDAGLLTEEAEPKEDSEDAHPRTDGKSAERAADEAGPESSSTHLEADLLTLIEIEQAELTLLEI